MTKHLVGRLRTAAPIVLIASTLLLAACGGDDDSMGGMSGMSESSSSSSPATEDATGAEFNDADVVFAQMMLPHHRQAVEMADMVLAKPDVDERVLAVAEQITAGQEPEIAQLTGFLETWGQEVPADSMGGMDMGGGMDGGSGMMSQEQMQQLQDATGVDASRLFLEQMVEHHAGALAMAQTETDGGQSPEALDLAQTIVDTQQAEITQMQDILATL